MVSAEKVKKKRDDGEGGLNEVKGMKVDEGSIWWGALFLSINSAVILELVCQQLKKC